MRVGEFVEVTSKSKKGVKYRVYSTTNGLKCTCPAFCFRKSSSFVCKHIKEVNGLLQRKA